MAINLNYNLINNLRKINNINFRCDKCGFIQLIKLKQENNKVVIFSKCRNNHKKICSLNDFMREIIKNNFNSICCSQCKCERQNLFFYCTNYISY